MKFKCPNCQRGLKGKPELAGRRAKCPACGAEVVVPQLTATNGVAVQPIVPVPVKEAENVARTGRKPPPPLPPSARVTTPADAIVQALRSFLPQDSLYVAPDIPQKKLANACRTCQVPPTERVLGLVDCTVFGSAKHALVFGSQAAYFHNDWTSDCRKGTIPYAEFPDRVFREKGLQKVDLGGAKQVLDVSGSQCSKKVVVSLLQAVAQVVRAQPPGRWPEQTVVAPGSAAAHVEKSVRAQRPDGLPENTVVASAPVGTRVVRTPVQDLAAVHLPNVQFRALGAAHWSTLGTMAGRAARTVLVNVAANAVLMPLGFGIFSLPGKKCRAGLIGVTDDTLYVIDMGTISGDALTLSALEKMRQPAVSQFPISTVQATHSTAGGKSVLQLHGAVQVTATFPDASAKGNSQAAADIAQLIQAAQR